MARKSKSKSGRSSTHSDTRSNASGRSRRSGRSGRSRASQRPLQSNPTPMEIAGRGDGGDAPLPSQKWQSSACCAGGCGSLYGLCVPCANATARHRLDGSSWCMNCVCLNPCAARNIVRRGYGIQGHCCADIMCSIMCAPCVSCQLLAETELRGSIHDDWSINPSRPRFEQPWKFGLLKCTDDLTTCAYGGCCMCPATATVRTQLDGSDWLFNLCFINPFLARSLVRLGYNIEGTDCHDCILTAFCMPCSICQMINETQHRGRLGAAPSYNAMQR